MPGGQAYITDQSLTSRMVALTGATADVATQETSTSTTYANLATTGPAVSPASGVTQNQLIIHTAQGGNSSGNRHYSSVAIAGASAVDADSGQGSWNTGSVGDGTHGSPIFVTAQASGATHTMKYRSDTSGTGRWARRRILAVPL